MLSELGVYKMNAQGRVESVQHRPEGRSTEKLRAFRVPFNELHKLKNLFFLACYGFRHRIAN